MTEVRCKVDSCVFWGRGDRCTADAIWVNHDFAREEDDDLLFMEDFEFAEDLVGSKESVTSSQTCCETMRPREDEISGGGCDGCR